MTPYELERMLTTRRAERDQLRAYIRRPHCGRQNQAAARDSLRRVETKIGVLEAALADKRRA